MDTAARTTGCTNSSPSACQDVRPRKRHGSRSAVHRIQPGEPTRDREVGAIAEHRDRPREPARLGRAAGAAALTDRAMDSGASPSTRGA